MGLNLLVKVKTAVFGNDNRVEWKNYELNDSGNRISIVKEGAGYFMPEIDNDSPLYFPSWKKFILFGERTYTRVYFVNNKAKKCYDFKRGELSLPDLEAIDTSIASTQLNKIGSPIQDIPWQIWAILASTVLNLLFVLNMSGVL